MHKYIIRFNLNLVNNFRKINDKIVTMSLGSKIKEVRLKNKLYQSEFASIFGISRETLCGYEIGRREPDINFVRKVCVYFKLDANEMLEIDTKEQIDKIIKDLPNCEVCFKDKKKESIS